MLLLVAPGSATSIRGLIIAVCTVLFAGLAGCSGKDTERARRFPFIHEPNFKIENPSRDHASATGMGCGGTGKEALLQARNTAKFNLRGVTGNGNYKIRFDLLKETSKEDRICVEVKATALGAV